ncbi:MAG: hypothetical protein AB1705_12060 [Verrucomicrobiota bacterium]
MNGTERFPAPLMLLIRVNLLQGWRRLLAVREQSRLLTSVILAFIIGYWWLSFMLFYRGLRFIGNFPGLGDVLVERLLYLLFAFLFVMLLFSNIVIGYTNLFRNRETQFLLTMPVSSQTIFRWKFIESSVLASWAFLFLIAPLLVAYGLNQHAPWHFYALTIVLVVLFIVLPTVVGSWFAITLARFMDRRVFQLSAIGSAIMVLIVATVYLQPEDVPEELLDTRVLGLMDRLLMRTNFAQHPLWPSYWLSSSVLQWQEGAIMAAGFFVLVLLSNVLFFGFLSFTYTGGPFYDAASAVQSRGSLFGHWEWFRDRENRKPKFTFPRGVAETMLGWIPGMPADIRALMAKDARVFWRDTTQWGQTLMLFGLLGVYIINLRHFSQQLANPFWVHLVSYLNLFACSLNLATLTTRFVYPQFSLEGKRLWIIGMAPLGMVRVVKAKFFMATVASLMVTLGLMGLSCHMLQLEWERTFYFSSSILVMSLTLNALSIGLGVLYPNFKEENPTKIVSGFGGTFCLVLSFLYIVASVVILAIGSPFSRVTELSMNVMMGCWLGFLVLSALIGWVPLSLALHRAEDFEV